MTKELYWCILLENYHNGDSTYYFKTYEIAQINFDKIIEAHKDFDEFELESDGKNCSWFDSTYNEYSTYVQLVQKAMPKIYNEIIF